MRALILATMVSRIAAAQIVIPPPPPPPPPAPSAGASGEDVVTLRDGTVLRGHVTELRAGDHVELVLLDGRARTIAWSEIAGSAGPSFPALKRNPADRWLQPGPGRVPVLLEAPRSLDVGVLRPQATIGQSAMTLDEDGEPVSQLTVDYQSRGGVVVCNGMPCRIYARPGPLKLQASGTGVLSYTADLDVPPSGARVRLRAPSLGAARGGSMLIVGSGAALVAGALVAAFGALPGIGSQRNVITGQVTDRSTGFYAAGGAVMGVGAALLIGGIAVLVNNQRGIEDVSPLPPGVHF